MRWKLARRWSRRSGIAALLLLTSGVAPAQGGLQITVTNDSAEALLVTLYDNVRGRTAVVTQARVEGFASLPVSVSTDASGRARVSWYASSADPNFRRCGHAEDVLVGDASSVTVSADSVCRSAR